MSLGYFIHPTSGEWLNATDDALKAARRDGYNEISRVKAALLPIQAELAERAGPATLPARRGRTALQDAVSFCPRCGGEFVCPECGWRAEDAA